MKFLTTALTLTLLLITSASAETVPFDGRIQRADFVTSLIKEGDICAEIGVDHGVFAYHVLRACKPSKLYLIDPWLADPQSVPPVEQTPEQEFRNKTYAMVCRLFSPYENIEIMRQKSQDAASNFPNEYFDFVYIDGEHSYTAVQRDLSKYFPKLKVGGYIVGDDYGWEGVGKSVQDFIAIHRDELFWGDDPYLGQTGGQYLIQRIK